MIFVYKKSATPVDPWGALRHGGVNNLSAGISDKYLVLMNVDIIHREGCWHYIFEFDGRNSLELSPLARLAGGKERYPGDMDWKAWLGQDWQVVSTSVREQILSLPPDNPLINVTITDMRAVPTPRPVTPRRQVTIFENPAEKPNYMLALPAVQ